jgi:hypothetical protein
MGCSPVYKGKRYNSLEEIKNHLRFELNSSKQVFKPRLNTSKKDMKNKYFRQGDKTTSLEVINKIADSNSKLAKLAQYLKPYVEKVNVNIYLQTNLMEGYDGVYYQQSREIDVKQDHTQKSDEVLLIHEIIHSLTVDVLNSNEPAKRKFMEYYNYAKQNIDGDFYGLKNEREFIVAVFSDKELIKTLSELPGLKNETSLFHEIYEFFASLIGIKKESNLFNETIEVAESVLNTALDLENNFIESFEKIDYFEPVDSIRFEENMTNDSDNPLINC